MKARIREAVKESLRKLDLAEVDFVVEHPADEVWGDYACNVAMKMGGRPKDWAERVKTELEKDQGLMERMERIEVAGSGFVNFWVKKKWLVEELGEIVNRGKSYGKSEWSEGKRVLVEYSSPNIAKEFSVGHLRSTIIGQALYNIYRFGGAEVTGDNHLGDWGTQFGMVIAALEEKGDQEAEMGVSELERIYVDYNQRAREDEKLLEKAREAFVRLEKGEKEARKIWEWVVDKSRQEFERVYQILGIRIDHAFGESAYEKTMEEVIKEVEEKGLLKKK